MEHGLSTHLVANHRLTSVWLERVWEAGIPLVELFCARQCFDYRNTAQVEDLGHWFADSELRVHSLHSPMYTDDCWGRSGPAAVVNIAETEKIRRMASVDEVKRALDVVEHIPFRYLIQHVGTGGEEWDPRKLDAAFTSLDELNNFARQRGVEVLLENTPNEMSNAERLLLLLEQTHLDNGFCFDIGHAHMQKGGVAGEYALMKERIRSTHIHDNDGASDGHLFPFGCAEGTIDWKKAMRLLRSREGQYPLLLELREVPGMARPMDEVKAVFERLENR